jgi:hypothetical protein
LYVLLCYNLFNSLIKKSIKRFSFKSYISILKNLDYGRNNKLYIITIYWGGGGGGGGIKNYMLGGAKFLNGWYRIGSRALNPHTELVPA